MKNGSFRRCLILMGVVLGALVLPAMAFAHLERPSYWPDPNPDRSVYPAAGGKVPELRSLSSAVYGKHHRKSYADVRVVCQGRGGWKSIDLLRESISKARKHGYRLRPSQPKLYLSRRDANELLSLNLSLARKCKYSEIQPAVTASGNNDRVIVLPGTYTEPTSRAQPLNDPRCADMTQTDSGGAKTPSYRYQVTCPNDQNLVHVAGRAVPPLPPPSPPLMNRQGIPDAGACVRCNLQLEGTGVVPTDVIVDGASDYESSHPEARPLTLDKHVIIRVDRADGFVVHNLTARGALEHGIYVEETDGYRIDTVKMFWAADYGNLTFTSDHGLYTDCDGFGSGDAVLYPGAAPETGEQADLSFYPDAPRINTTVRRCDMRGSVLAYSGSMGNAVRLTQNNIYGNTAGISTDTISAGGHPGYPADGVRGGSQLHLLEQPGPLRREPAGGSGGGDPALRGRHLLGRPQLRPGARQLDLGQLARRRLAALDPGLPRHSRGQHQPGRRVQERRPREPDALHVMRQPLLRQPAGPRAAGLQSLRRPVQVRQQRGADPRRRPERRGLLVGRGRSRHRLRQLLVQQRRRPTARSRA